MEFPASHRIDDRFRQQWKGFIRTGLREWWYKLGHKKPPVDIQGVRNWCFDLVILNLPLKRPTFFEYTPVNRPKLYSLGKFLVYFPVSWWILSADYMGQLALGMMGHQTWGLPPTETPAVCGLPMVYPMVIRHGSRIHPPCRVRWYFPNQLRFGGTTEVFESMIYGFKQHIFFDWPCFHFAVLWFFRSCAGPKQFPMYI